MCLQNGVEAITCPIQLCIENSTLFRLLPFEQKFQIVEARKPMPKLPKFKRSVESTAKCFTRSYNVADYTKFIDVAFVQVQINSTAGIAYHSTKIAHRGIRMVLTI
jgi:hypothetical protein